jgi:hypothetical protein
VNTCTECLQPLWHRSGFPDHGETSDYQYRVTTCKPDSDVCEQSATGYHNPDHGPTWTDLAWAREHLDMDTPVGIRRAVCRIFSSYRTTMPRGLCDPQYIANVIAAEVQR